MEQDRPEPDVIVLGPSGATAAHMSAIMGLKHEDHIILPKIGAHFNGSPLGGLVGGCVGGIFGPVTREGFREIVKPHMLLENIMPWKKYSKLEHQAITHRDREFKNQIKRGMR